MRASKVFSVIVASAIVVGCATVAGECPTACTQDIDPVCGTDGNTYQNECYLLIQKCSEDWLEVDFAGSCKPADCRHDCSDEAYAPLCGSNLVTYNNTCLLQNAQCLSGSIENPDISHLGVCEPQSSSEPSLPPDEATTSPPVTITADICPPIQSPVCGSNGQTYSNLCLLAVARQDSRSTYPKWRGSCSERPAAPSISDECDFPCAMVFRPVCQPNGKIFENKCTFFNALCQDMSIATALEAYCDPLLLAAARTLRQFNSNT